MNEMCLIAHLLYELALSAISELLSASSNAFSTLSGLHLFISKIAIAEKWLLKFCLTII